MDNRLFTWGAALLALASIGAPLHLRAQDALDPAQLLDDADKWVSENIDDSVLDALGIDAGETRQFLKDLQKSFQGEYVLDLAALRDTATRITPLLAKYEETEPYALWLKAHLDYFDAAEQLRQRTPTNATGLNVKPTPQMERKVWVEMVERKPLARPPRDVTRLKEIFREEGVPAELVWVAEVESSFNPKARSPAGAAGLFQLMPVTARSMNLSVGLFRDERLDADKSARAAAKYLKHLYTRFGDWRLALAAYNCGENRLADLLKKQKTRTFDAVAMALPAETQMYVPKVEAVIRKRENRELKSLRA